METHPVRIEQIRGKFEFHVDEPSVLELHHRNIAGRERQNHEQGVVVEGEVAHLL